MIEIFSCILSLCNGIVLAPTPSDWRVRLDRVETITVYCRVFSWHAFAGHSSSCLMSEGEWESDRAGLGHRCCVATKAVHLRECATVSRVCRLQSWQGVGGSSHN